MPVHYVGIPRDWHDGELSAQRALNFDRFVQGGTSLIEDHMDTQHSTFHASLAFLALTTLDEKQRPWASLLAASDGERGFISAPDRYTLRVKAARIPGDPAEGNLLHGSPKLVAGVGVELLNRRRNKFGGVLKSCGRISDSEMEIQLRVNSTMGNCPKYINVRELVARPERTVKVVAQEDEHDPRQPLPQSVLDHIAKVDSIYIATVYLPEQHEEESHAGMNHRGGRPGFIRVDPETKSAVYLPDYSGNRLMQSVGNMLSNPVAGMALPDWNTGNVLLLTGTVKNYLAEQAKQIMRSVHGITRLDVTGYHFIQGALPLVQKGETFWSSYNPPVRFLNDEPDSGFNRQITGVATAQITTFRSLTEDLAVFTFHVSGAGSIGYQPGQFAVLDCSSFLHPSSRVYQHMAARGQESTLNDDGIRSWTISRWHQLNENEADMEITMRMKEGGVVTPILFALGRAVNEREGGHFHGQLAITFPLYGIAGHFTPPQVPKKQLWLAAGVGITPFLAFARMLKADDDIEMILVSRVADVEAFEQVLTEALPPQHNLKLRLYISNAAEKQVNHLAPSKSLRSFRQAGRPSPSHFSNSDVFSDLQDRDVYLCGTDAFRTSTLEGLQAAGVDAAAIHYESFSF